MSNLSILMSGFVLCFAGSVATFLIYFGIISGINSKHNRNVQASITDRDILGAIRKYRLLFPQSKLPVAMVTTLVFTTVSVFCLILVSFRL